MNRRDFFRLLGIPAITLTSIKILGFPKSDDVFSFQCHNGLLRQEESIGDQMARAMNELADKIDKIFNENCWDAGY